MFKECINLAGGNGTKYNSNNVSGAYAVSDEVYYDYIVGDTQTIYQKGYLTMIKDMGEEPFPPPLKIKYYYLDAKDNNAEKAFPFEQYISVYQVGQYVHSEFTVQGADEPSFDPEKTYKVEGKSISQWQ